MMIGVFLLIIGIFMEPLPATFMLVPGRLPMAQAVGIDFVHVGPVMVLNLAWG